MEAGAAAVGPPPVPSKQKVAASPKLADAHDQALRLAEAQRRGGRTIEAPETAEPALVGKTAGVVAEVALKLVGSEHVQTLHGKLHRQGVKLERVGSDGRVREAR